MIRKGGLWSSQRISKRLQRDHFTVVADEGDGFIGHALAGGQILGLRNLTGETAGVRQPRLVQTERRLEFQDLAHRLIELQAVDFAAAHGLQHRAVTGVEIGGNDQHVIAGLEGFDRGAADILRVQARQPCHVEGVGDNDPLESHFFFEQAAHHGLGSCGDAVGLGVERGNGYVRDHHGIHAGLDRAPERRQLNRVEPGAVAGDLREAKMRIGGGVAVSGKVFCRDQHAAFVSAPDVRRHQIADLMRVFSERARVDDGIRRIGIHVGIGKEIPMHSDGPCFQRRNASKGLGIFRFAGRAKGHCMGKDGGAIQTHGYAALEIR